MRRYAKDMAHLAECRRQMEKVIRKDAPTLSPSDVRRLAKGYVMRAYKEMKSEVPEQRADGIPSTEDGEVRAVDSV